MLGSMIYSRKQRAKAVNLSALLGWSVFALPYSAGLGQGKPSAVWEAFLWCAGIGMPIAFLSCWLIGAPILTVFMRREVTWIRAATCGGFIALAIALVSIAFSRYHGWRQSLDPSSWSSKGAVGNPREIDGILTVHGWLQTAERTAWFVGLGVVIALAVRLIIGRPKEMSKPSEKMT